MFKTSFVKGVLLCQLTAISGSAFFPLYQSASAHTTPLLAAYALFCFAWMASIFLAVPYYHRLRYIQFTRKHVVLFLVVGIASLLGNASIVLALNELPASSAHLLQRSETLFAVFIGLFLFKEGGGLMLGISVILFSLGVLSIHQDPTRISGNFLPLAAGITSAFCFAIMQAATRLLLSNFNAHLINVFRLTLLVLTMSILNPSILKTMYEFPADVLTAFALAALCGPVMSRVSYMNAAYHIGVARAALFASTSPIFTLLLQFLIFGVVLSIGQLLGSVLLLIAVLLPIITQKTRIYQ